jgi:hypothetical protein
MVTHVQQIDGAIQAGRGAAATVLGQTYDVYRLTNATNNSVVSGTPHIAAFQARIRKITDKKAIENVPFDIQVFEFTCDNRALVPGDILVETGYEGDGGKYAFAQRRPTRESIFVRVERNVSLSRPTPAGGSSAQQPSSGAIKAPGYIGITKATEEILTLTSGVYAFETSGPIATVPFGLQPQNRIRSPHKPDSPTQVPEVQFVGYLPFMPGIQVIENDVISSDNSDRYVVVQVYQSDTVGLQGWILILRKMAV